MRSLLNVMSDNISNSVDEHVTGIRVMGYSIQRTPRPLSSELGLSCHWLPKLTT